MLELRDLNEHNYPTTPGIDANLNTLLERLRVIEKAYGIDFIVTSGLRSQAQQEGLIADGKSHAMHSKHCIGASADLSDSEGKLKKWCLENVKLFEDMGLWMEDFKYTAQWMHCQIYPPKSGNRFFIP